MYELCRLGGPSAAMMVRRGNRHFERNDDERALWWYTKAIRWSPRNWYAFANRGVVRFRTGKIEDARSDFLQAQAIHPSRLDIHWNLGVLSLQAGETERAISEWTHAVEGGVRHADIFFNRGYARFQLKQFTLALEDLNEAVRLSPENAENLYWRGLTRSELGDQVGAGTDLSQAVELDPKHGETPEVKAFLASHRGDHKLALELYEERILSDSSNPYWFNGAAWILATGPDDLRNGVRAVELAQKACELSKLNDGNYVGTLAAAYAETGNFDEAIKWQEQAASLYTSEELAEWGFLIDLYRAGRPYRQPSNSDQPATP